MEIGFVSFNQEALNRANKVMKLLQGQGAIDELGLGRIRDAFSNTMFPGMSVLQTHAKYFLLLPALYAYLEKSRISDVREAREVVRDHEINFTYRLMDGSPADITGIIGADMLRRKEGYVKYDPTYVYQAGMEIYGLIPRGGNIYATLAERSAINQEIPKKNRESADGNDDSPDLQGTGQIFITCGEDYDFKHHAPLDIALTYKEAEFLKNKIAKSTADSLLSYLLDSGLFENVTDTYFDRLGEKLLNIPEKLFYTYRLALRYSRFACLLRMRYAMLYDLAAGADKPAEDERARFDATLRNYRQEFEPEAIEEIIRFVDVKINEESCKTFISQASDLIASGNFDELDRQIVLREKSIKGLKRSKLINAKTFKSEKPFESPKMMSYRWDTIVLTVLKEIKEGLEKKP